MALPGPPGGYERVTAPDADLPAHTTVRGKKSRTDAAFSRRPIFRAARAAIWHSVRTARRGFDSQDDGGKRMSRNGNGQLWAVVLAAGEGSRMTPLTRALYGRPLPKQFAALDA